MPKRHSPLDQPLADAAAKIAGVPITRTQIEDWREAGYLEVVRSGDRPGRYTYAYAPRSESLAAYIGAVLHKGRAEGRVPTMEEAVLTAFVLGRLPKESGLRHAYDTMYRRIELAGEQPPTPKELSRYSRRATRYPLTRALKEHVERPGDLPSVLENIGALALGQTSTVTPQTAEAIFGAFGLPTEMAKQVLEEPPRPPMREMPAIISTASLEELVRGRDHAVLFTKVWKNVSGYIASELGFELKVPVGLPDLFSDLMTALFWVPRQILKRRELGAEAHERHMEVLRAATPDVLAREFGRTDAKSSLESGRQGGRLEAG